MCLITSKCTEYQYIAHSRTRQAIYVSRNTQARSHNHCCRGKLQVLNLQSACFCFVALVNQVGKAHAPYYIATCSVSGSVTLLHIIPLAVQFSGGGVCIEYKMRVLIFSKNMLILREIQRNIIINVPRKERVIPVRL